MKVDYYDLKKTEISESQNETNNLISQSESENDSSNASSIDSHDATEVDQSKSLVKHK